MTEDRHPCPPEWPEVWEILKRNLRRCSAVSTLCHGVINDIVAVTHEGIIVRSHRTMIERPIAACVFEAWWRHLVSAGRASLDPGLAPAGQDSRIVGAILANCLRGLVEAESTNSIRLCRLYGTRRDRAR